MRGIGRLKKIGRHLKHVWQNRNRTPVQKALHWAKINSVPGQGIQRFPRKKVASEEITGYIIPTLWQLGERALARRFVTWEASTLQPDGAILGDDGIPYTFDTAQAARGFLALLDEMPSLLPALRKTCDYVVDHIANDGEVLTESYESWKFDDGTMLSPYGHLYCLPPLLEAGEKLGEKAYSEAALHALDYYRRRPDVVEFKPDRSTLSHYFGYMMEALVDLGATELARKGLERAADIQHPDGTVPAYPGADWTCSTGAAQLAIAWYKLGMTDPADRAMEALVRVQNASGGFFGSYGEDAAYFPTTEISWAVKFFLDAVLLRVQANFNKESAIYSETIGPEDGRTRAVLEFFGDMEQRRVLDVGCGKGRFLRQIHARFPRANLHGIDLSEKMLARCPDFVTARQGSMLNLPYENDHFDCVFSVEALEHALLPENSIREMTRVLRPGGKLLIIDKNADRRGALKIKPWEQWFRPDRVIEMLAGCGIESESRFITYEDHARPDGLFVAWQGRKTSKTL